MTYRILNRVIQIINPCKIKRCRRSFTTLRMAAAGGVVVCWVARKQHTAKEANASKLARTPENRKFLRMPVSSVIPWHTASVFIPREVSKLKSRCCRVLTLLSSTPLGAFLASAIFHPPFSLFQGDAVNYRRLSRLWTVVRDLSSRLRGANSDGVGRGFAKTYKKYKQSFATASSATKCSYVQRASIRQPSTEAKSFWGSSKQIWLRGSWF